MTRASLFVTGTGTELGKTLVTSALCAQMAALGTPVTALKPVASGVEMDNLAASDPGQILLAQGREVTPDTVAELTPWLFGAPLAPHIAARREGRRLEFDPVVDFCQGELARARTPVLIEGAGGVMAPVTEERLVIDWIAALGMPVLLVAGAYLGTISHILTACAALEARGLRADWIVISDKGDAPMPFAELHETLRGFLPGVPISLVPTLPPSARPFEGVPDLLADWPQAAAPAL